MIVFAQCTLFLDSFLKQSHRSKKLSAANKDTAITVDKDKDGIDDRKDNAIFNINDIENWVVMAPLSIILGVIMVWCFYFRFMKAVLARRRLIWVEVLN